MTSKHVFFNSTARNYSVPVIIFTRHNGTCIMVCQIQAKIRMLCFYTMWLQYAHARHIKLMSYTPANMHVKAIIPGVLYDNTICCNYKAVRQCKCRGERSVTSRCRHVCVHVVCRCASLPSSASSQTATAGTFPWNVQMIQCTESSIWA